MNVIQDMFRYAKIAYDEPTGSDPLFSDCIDYVSMVNDVDFAFIANYSDRLVISFRGTDNLKGWISDFHANPSAEGCTIEQGFYDGWVEFKRPIQEYIVQYRDKPIFCVGHSRGAALSTLCARHLAKNMGLRCSNINFGSPQVFARGGRDEYNFLPINTTRCVNGWDIVTSLPPDGMGYRHVGTVLQFPQPLWHRYFYRIRDHIQSSYQGAIDKYVSMH